MLNVLRLVIAPLVSLFIFTLGSGLFTTLLALRLHESGASTFIVGLMTAAYYGGLFCGSFRSERFIVRVGHIRAYACFASTLAVISMVQGFFVNEAIWVLLRLVGGFATAGLFIVIESWLLVQGTIKTRGKILAIYMIVFYAAQGSGQFFITIGHTHELTLFALTAILCSLSVIPLAVTFTRTPEFDEPSSLNFAKLYKASPSGVVGCFSSGLILGAVYGLLPLFIRQRTADTTIISSIMAAVIYGGMALQYPLGHLSDYIGRRFVLIISSACSVALGLVLLFFFHLFWFAVVMFFLFGGMVFALYPLSISLACDNLDSKDIVAGTQGLLLAYSIGSMLGPIIAPAFMSTLGFNGLLIYFIAISALLTIYFSWRRTRKPSTPREESFVSITQTTPIMSELDPRGSENE